MTYIQDTKRYCGENSPMQQWVTHSLKKAICDYFKTVLFFFLSEF